MAYFSAILTVIISAVKKSATAMARDFNELEHLQNSQRSDNMFAMRSVEKVTKTLKEELSKAKAGFKVIDAQKEPVLAAGNYFLINAADGYANFAHGNGAFAICVAMVENNAVVDAVVYNPVTDELFFAEKGCGAFKEGFRNHERLRIAGAKNIDNALIYCNVDETVLQSVLNISKNIRISGAASLDLAYVAAAKADAVIAQNVDVASIAAGLLLVKESGGYVFAIGDKDIRSEDLQKVMFGGNIVATNEALRQKLANTLVK